jgi:hypothetical protein
LAFAFGYGYGLAGGYIREMIDLPAGPAELDRIGLLMLGQAEGKDEFAGGKITGAAAQHLRLGVSSDGGARDGANAIPIGFCAD